MNTTLNEKVKLLKKDILNGPLHVFGCHARCDRYLSSILIGFGEPDKTTDYNFIFIQVFLCGN